MAGWFWLIAWALWWLIVVLGVKGTSPVMAVIGLLSLPVLLRKRPTFSLDAIVFLALLVWCVMTSFWSEGANRGLIIVDLANENIAIQSPGLRLAFAALVCTFGYWALHQLPDTMYPRVRWAAVFGMGVVALIVCVAAASLDLLMQVGLSISNAENLDGNLLRSLNLVILSVPVFVLTLKLRDSRIAVGLGVILFGVLGYLAYRLGGTAAMLSIPAIGVMAGLVWLFGRHIFRLLGVLTAVLIMLMPVGVDTFLSNVDTDDLPSSSLSRVYAYEYVGDKIEQKWLTGWGVEASKTWKENVPTPIVGPNGQLVSDFPVVPGHPHNMSLQVWAETGLIGALLLSAFALLLGERLYQTGSDRTSVQIAGASLWAGAIVHGLVSYSVWNDVFWGGLLFLATGILVATRTDRAKGKMS